MSVAKDQKQRTEPSTLLAMAMRGNVSWLGALLLGKRGFGDVDLVGFSVRYNGSGWLVVVRGLEYPTLINVVAYGSSMSLYTALSNCGLAISKGEWRKDKFRPTPVY